MQNDQFSAAAAMVKWGGLLTAADAAMLPQNAPDGHPLPGGAAIGLPPTWGQAKQRAKDEIKTYVKDVLPLAISCRARYYGSTKQVGQVVIDNTP